MEISKILNLSHEACHTHCSSGNTTPASTPHLLAPIDLPRRQKVPKDAPIFSEGNKVVGFVNYPPHESGDDCALLAQHRRFKIFPLGQIYSKGIRHIPYNSDKKDFLEKTGREAFEVFHYTYKRPGEDKEYVVVWDYNVGLVRMTPFFKSCKFSKTVPAKALRENPGMKDISYSITGGALVCQGYWMPFEAAKAIAATFCYDIRWALTPIFGNDFPSTCTPPSDPHFAKFVIDPRIVQQCTEETDRFREEGEWYKLRRVPETPRPKFGTPPWSVNIKTQPRMRLVDTESGYGTDTDSSDKHMCSPHFSPRSQHSGWRAINGLSSSPAMQTPAPSTAASPTSTYAPTPQIQIQIPSSVPAGHCSESMRMKRTHSQLANSACTGEATNSPFESVAASNAISNSARVYSGKPHSAEEVEVANILVWMSQGKPTPYVAEPLPSMRESMMLSPLPPPPKRTRVDRMVR